MTATIQAEVIGKTRLYLADVDNTSADEIRSAVRDFYRDFPSIAPLLADVALDPEFFADKPGSYAATWPDRLDRPIPPYHVRLNAKFYVGARDEFVSSLLDDYTHGFHGYSAPIGNIQHELGHVVDFAAAHYCGLNYGASAYALQERDAATISGYALQGGPMESWADAFAARRLGRPVGNANVSRALDKVIAEATRP